MQGRLVKGAVGAAADDGDVAIVNEANREERGSDEEVPRNDDAVNVGDEGGVVDEDANVVNVGDEGGVVDEDANVGDERGGDPVIVVRLLEKRGRKRKPAEEVVGVPEANPLLVGRQGIDPKSKRFRR